MLVNDLNDCKIKLNSEIAKLTDLEEKLKESEAKTDRVRYPIIGGVITSFVLNTLGHIIMNPFVVLGSLLMLAFMIPAYIVFFKFDGKSGKIEEQIKQCKENIQKYEEELERLNSRMEVESLVHNYANIAPLKMEALPIRINNHNKRNNKSR